jgi:lipoyl(octanoyl) transferase
MTPTPIPIRPLDVRRLGVVGYGDALAMQRALVEDCKAGRVPDTLLLLQHPPVITLGVKGDGGKANIVATPEQLAELGIEVHETGRGGDVTYHGPGQIVGYPIIDLKPDRCDVHRYVRDVEDVLVRVCAEWGVTAGRIKGLTGAWVSGARGPEKIGAIGVRISRWVTSHGFAFNVGTNLDHFRLIVPCGIPDRGVTSLEEATGCPVPIDRVEDALARHFAEVFSRSPQVRLKPDATDS